MTCHTDHENPPGPPRALKLVAWAVFLAGGGYYLWMQHRAHVLQYAPLAVFLLCPLMHFFGHGGHGRGTDDRGGRHDE